MQHFYWLAAWKDQNSRVFQEQESQALPILMMGTCLEELMEFSISLAEIAREKMGQ